MVKMGDEARPARRMPVGNEARWTIPPNTRGTLELAYAWTWGTPVPGAAGQLRILRSKSGTLRPMLANVRAEPSNDSRWMETDIPWTPNPHAETLRVQFDAASPGSSPGQVLYLAEPIIRPAAERTNREDVLLFVIDTLRADGLSCYSPNGAPTPEIDRLAKEGLRVDRALTPANWTLPAHSSLFASAGVARHQVGLTRSTLGNELPTLAQVLAKKGYRALAVTNGGYVDPAFGVARGFDRYVTIDVRKYDVETNVEAALRLLRQYRNEPVFLFFHTYEVHEYPRNVPARPDGKTVSERLLQVSRERAAYRQVTSRVDTAFGELLRGLDGLRLAGKTLIIVTADHGEMFYDHPAHMGNFIRGHGQPFLYDEELRVPLIYFDPHNPARES